jgi:membrane-associated phospholipid phosphatase
LLASRPVRAALAWVLALALCNGMIAALKIYFYACPAGSALRSPSGHTGFSVLVYGGIAVILAREIRSRGWRIAVTALGIAVVVVVATTRLLLGLHSPAEIALGALIGAAGLAAFSRVYRVSRGGRGRLAPLGLLLILVAAAFHGWELRIEDYLQGISAALGVRPMACAR